MAKTVSVHSYRGGTGKSNISANLSYVLAQRGFRVCVVDTDIQSPGIHIVLGVKEQPEHTLNDYLWGKAAIQDVALDVSERAGLPAGRLYLVPSSIKMGEITKVLKEGYDVGLLNKGFRALKEELKLDYLIIDTHPGLNEETLLSVAVSDCLILIMRPDQQDFQGSSVTVEVARRLKVSNIRLVLNKVLSFHEPEQIRERLQETYQCPVAGILPLSEKMIELGSAGLMTRVLPDEAWSKEIHKIADSI